jgi:hypothetical protein
MDSQESHVSKKFGRVTVDDRGIRKGRTFLLFGTQFDLTWDQIDSWDFVEAVRVSPQSEQVVSHILELRSGGKVHHVRLSGSAADYDALIEEIRRSAPDKHEPGILRQISALRAAGAI